PVVRARHSFRSTTCCSPRSTIFPYTTLFRSHHRLTPIEAARLGKDLEPFRLFWLEDPVPAENQEGFKLIRQHTTTPLAVGEVFKDRKSTRLNSSHVKSSYAVFCLKKKNLNSI